MTKVEGPILEWIETAGAAAGPFVLLQGYPYTGFAVVRDGKLILPPATRRAPEALNWETFWDVRVFGSGERHAWRYGHDWYWRPRTADELKNEPFREYALWGTRLQAPAADDEWRCLSEENGAALWIPPEFPLFEEGQKGQFPLRLKVKLFVGRDETVGTDGVHGTGLAGIVDSALCSLVQEVGR